MKYFIGGFLLGLVTVVCIILKAVRDRAKWICEQRDKQISD